MKNLLPGLLLTMTGGFIDAVGFIAMGGFFASFMSGNTTQLGVGLAHVGPFQVFMPFILLVLFFSGGFAGSLLSLRGGRWAATRVLGLTLILLACATVLGLQGHAMALVLLAAAMGAQNAVLSPSGPARLGATYVTGTLFSAAQDLARAIYKQAPRWQFSQHLAVWAALMLGAIGGSLMQAAYGLQALYVPIAVIGCLFAASIATKRFHA